MYEATGIGYRIGNISVNSTASVDDIVLISEEQDQTQILINMAYDYAYMEGVGAYSIPPCWFPWLTWNGCDKFPSHLTTLLAFSCRSLISP
jgi:hypothetical protein